VSAWVLELVQEALGLGVLVALPFVAAAVVGSIVAGLLQWLSGLQDPVVGTIARAVAIVVALVLLAGPLAGQLRTYAREAWAELPRVGRPGS
jgi:type III secretory pathway component EscS